MTDSLTDVVSELHHIATLLDHDVTTSPDPDDLRRTIARLTDAADEAAFDALEQANHPQVHNAFACAKELAVLSIVVDHATRHAPAPRP